MTQPDPPHPAERVTHLTQVGAWHCDTQGHMNTRHIEAMFDDATAMAFGLLGADMRALAGQGVGWADRRHTFEFLAEILASDLIEVRSFPLRVGTSSISFAHRMRHVLRGELLATAEVVTVCFDLDARRSRPLPADIAEAATAWLAETGS